MRVGRRLLALALLALASSVPSAAPSKADWEKVEALLDGVTARLEQNFLARLPSLTIERLYILDPLGETDEGTPLFHDWVIAAEGDPLPSALAQNVLKRALRDMVLSDVRGEAICFTPRHAMVLTDGQHRFDVLVCFECSKYEIHIDSGQPVGDSFSVDTQAVWDRAFAAAGLLRENGDTLSP